MVGGNSIFFDTILQILESRWNKSNIPLHCMAHSLVPKYYCEAWLKDGINRMPRIAPHEDQEVSVNRSKCFKRLFPNSNDLKKVYIEYGAFSSGSNYFNQPHVIDARMFEEPISWWANHGASTPLLQSLAFKLLSQLASSSCRERNWSTYSFIQIIKRNKLTTSRTEDLVFVHCNLRLMSRNEEAYKKGPTKYWDLCEDNTLLDGETTIELAELSVDEPQLQTFILDDDE
ncbi:pentatricopeptide repeat-containing At1g64100-like [Olea europaea subsp. europaea]|uniref:Pentatricopeptide repeat-containing At1g64100-like n=1 Tax=Olea europaea subsp. europaea TaxID=158383 RepID=A0A8S0TSE7_OLEEU|nr:pentatricopeptide repeat-containing At1g64100-like [Olea europaea subsp. europaea]